VFVMVQRDQQEFERCSGHPSSGCVVDSPFTHVGDDGSLTVRIKGSNKVGQESKEFPLRLNDIGL